MAPASRPRWGRASAAAVLIIAAAEALAAAALAGPTPGALQQRREGLDDLAVEAYWFLYPLVTMDVMRRQALNTPVPVGVPGAAVLPTGGTNASAAGLPAGTVAVGPNRFVHLRSLPDVKTNKVVRPNFDTLYSSAYLDLTKGPVVLSAPDTGGRYYLLPILDMWTDAFAAPGTRTSGNQAGAWAVVPPGWTGTLPSGIGRIDAPTPYVWIIGRTYVNGTGDYPSAFKVQDGFKLTPLGQYGNPAKAPAQAAAPFAYDRSVNMTGRPADIIAAMSGEQFFTYGAELMALHRPHATDWSMVQGLRKLGIVPGKPLNWTSLPAPVKAALSAAPKAALADMHHRAPTVGPVVSGWQMSTDNIGVYGNSYLKRAITALTGIGTNAPEDAVYATALRDASGNKITSPNKYELRFPKGQLPPAGAFWSVTAYDGSGYPVLNPLHRYALGDRDPLKFGPDGSLTIYLQPQSPGKDKESNWLPTPTAGELGAMLRVYAPGRAALDGAWVPPPVKRVA